MCVCACMWMPFAVLITICMKSSFESRREIMFGFYGHWFGFKGSEMLPFMASFVIQNGLFGVPAQKGERGRGRDQEGRSLSIGDREYLLRLMMARHAAWDKPFMWLGSVEQGWKGLSNKCGLSSWKGREKILKLTHIDDIYVELKRILHFKHIQ